MQRTTKGRNRGRKLAPINLKQVRAGRVRERTTLRDTPTMVNLVVMLGRRSNRMPSLLMPIMIFRGYESLNDCCTNNTARTPHIGHRASSQALRTHSLSQPSSWRHAVAWHW